MRVIKRERSTRSKTLRVGNYTVVVECSESECTVKINNKEWRIRGVFEEACFTASESEDVCLNREDIYS